MVDFALDSGSAIPTLASVGYLSAELAGEGMKIDMTGDDVAFIPPPPKSLVPDWSEIKPIRKYFNRKGYQVYPCWLYHPTAEPVIVINADEAVKYGVAFRLATKDERDRYGIRTAWDFLNGTKWRTVPYEGRPSYTLDKFSNVKTVIHSSPTSAQQQNALVEALIPQVAAAVAAAMKGSVPNAPANIAAADWEEFQKFMAWKKSADVVAEVAGAVVVDQTAPDTAEAASEAGEEDVSEDEIALWRTEAERLGVKVDKRWRLARLQAEVEKVA